MHVFLQTKHDAYAQMYTKSKSHLRRQVCSVCNVSDVWMPLAKPNNRGTLFFLQIDRAMAFSLSLVAKAEPVYCNMCFL